jgi:hypothetical protein
MLLHWQPEDEYTELNDNKYFHNFEFNIHVIILFVTVVPSIINASLFC